MRNLILACAVLCFAGVGYAQQEPQALTISQAWNTLNESHSYGLSVKPAGTKEGDTFPYNPPPPLPTKDLSSKELSAIRGLIQQMSLKGTLIKTANPDYRQVEAKINLSGSYNVDFVHGLTYALIAVGEVNGNSFKLDKIRLEARFDDVKIWSSSSMCVYTYAGPIYSEYAPDGRFLGSVDSGDVAFDYVVYVLVKDMKAFWVNQLPK